MKNSLPVLSVLLLATVSLAAQTTETIRVSAGNDIASAVSAYGIYRFPAFVNGTIWFKDGKLGKETLNYNILNDQLMYIDKKGDTLAVAFPEEIKKIDLNGVGFYYDKKGWLESFAQMPEASLIVKNTMILHYEKSGAFGISNSTNGIDSYTAFTSNNASYHLYLAEDATLKKITSYYLLTKDERLLPASKSSFLRYFSKNKKDIQDYLDNHKVNFNNTQDLIQLMSIGISGKLMP